MEISYNKYLMTMLYNYFVEDEESYYVIIMKDYGGVVLNTHLKYLNDKGILGMRNGKLYDLKNMYCFKNTNAPYEFRTLIENTSGA